MAQIPKGYPGSLSTKQLQAAIGEFTNEINEPGAGTDKVLRLSACISLGLTELQSRRHDLIMRVAMGIGFGALIVAAVALLVALRAGTAAEEAMARQTLLLQDSNVQLTQARQALQRMAPAAPRKAPASEPSR